MKKLKVVIALLLFTSLIGCDKINNFNRSLDTILGGDFDVYIQGQPQPFRVNNGKITSVPEKGYYVFYPIIDGKERLVQSPIQATTIIQTN